jgi:hypothetical protein
MISSWIPSWIPSFRSFAAAAALLVTLAPAATAGGLHAKIEGPAADGVTYTVRTYACDENTSLDPWGIAEGVVDGKPRMVLLRLKPTSEHGVYRFTRAWPADGHWMIRVSLGHPPAPATVTALNTDGTVKSNKLYYKSDGSQECRKALRAWMDPSEEDC